MDRRDDNMSNKFHINKHGVPAPCRARSGNCPLGGSEQHFNTAHEAQEAADNEHEREFGLIPKSNKGNTQVKNSKYYKKALSKQDREYIRNRKDSLGKEGRGTNYINRCKSTKRLDDFVPPNEKTGHFSNDRKHRSEELTKVIGEGDLIGYYRVNHLVGVKKESRYREQIVEVRDNGRLTIYDNRTGRTVTTFMAHRQRVEVMLLQAGEIPQESMLKRVTRNRSKASKKGLD